MRHINIAIDGPAGAGKSTVAKAVAKALNILYLDTGAMYRAVALKAIRQGIDPNDAERVKPMLKTTRISVKNEAGVQHTLLDGEDVSAFIRTQEVSKGASDIGVIPEVRLMLVHEQQLIAAGTDLVMEGRDIGSYVIPDSPCKFFITASSLERAKRRLKQLQESGKDEGRSIEQLKQEIESRDYTDAHRAFAPLIQTEDAVLIDTTDMTIEQAVEAVIKRVQKVYSIGGER